MVGRRRKLFNVQALPQVRQAVIEQPRQLGEEHQRYRRRHQEEQPRLEVAEADAAERQPELGQIEAHEREGGERVLDARREGDEVARDGVAIW